MDSEVIELMKKELESYSVSELKTELSHCFDLTKEYLVRTALCLQELEKRGEKVDGIDYSILKILRKIASGEVLPELVIEFADSPKVLSKLIKEPVEKQEEILSDEDKKKEAKKPGRYTPRADREYNPIAVVKNADARDLADMIVGMIEKHSHPDQVWDLIVHDARIKQLEVFV